MKNLNAVTTSAKYCNKAINIINKKLEDFGNPEVTGYTRIYIKNASASLLEFCKDNQDKIKAQVVLVKRKEDEAAAASARNTNGFNCHTLFVFSDDYYYVPNYFSGTCDLIELPKTILKQIKDNFREVN